MATDLIPLELHSADRTMSFNRLTPALHSREQIDVSLGDSADFSRAARRPVGALSIDGLGHIRCVQRQRVQRLRNAGIALDTCTEDRAISGALGT